VLHLWPPVSPNRLAEKTSRPQVRLLLGPRGRGGRAGAKCQLQHVAEGQRRGDRDGAC
jgi:hypothetical protein